MSRACQTFGVSRAAYYKRRAKGPVAVGPGTTALAGAEEVGPAVAPEGGGTEVGVSPEGIRNDGNPAGGAMGQTNGTGKTVSKELDEDLAEKIAEILKTRAPVALGHRRVWAILRFERGIPVNKKKVQRIMKLKRWQAKPIRRPKRLPLQAGDPRRTIVDPKAKVAAQRPNERWAIDLTKFFVEETGWVCLIPVLCCCTRKVLGWYLGVQGRAIEAFEAVRDATIREFGSLAHLPAGITLRQDNGCIFLARYFLDAIRDLKMETEYTPYRCPSANGIAERFMRTLKEECVWHYRFESIEQARAVIGEWIRRYNAERPHSSLGYVAPEVYAKRFRGEAA